MAQVSANLTVPVSKLQEDDWTWKEFFKNLTFVPNNLACAASFDGSTMVHDAGSPWKCTISKGGTGNYTVTFLDRPPQGYVVLLESSTKIKYYTAKTATNFTIATESLAGAVQDGLVNFWVYKL